MIPSRFRAHIVTTALVIGTGAIAYGTYNVAMSLKRWTRAPARQMHDEMEEYIMRKELEARRRSELVQKQ